jgi:hypothetical protein
MADNQGMYEMECCNGEHEDFTVTTSCPAECGADGRVFTIRWCGDESVPHRCRCGATLERATAY